MPHHGTVSRLEQLASAYSPDGRATLDFANSARKARYEGLPTNSNRERDLTKSITSAQEHQISASGLHIFDKASRYTDNKFALARFSAYAWKAVKIWEVFHRHHLENVADEMYCTTPDPDQEYCEPLGGWDAARMHCLTLRPIFRRRMVKSPSVDLCHRSQDKGYVSPVVSTAAHS